MLNTGPLMPGEINRVVTPEGMQKWGQIQADVEGHGRAIERMEGRATER